MIGRLLILGCLGLSLNGCAQSGKADYQKRIDFLQEQIQQQFYDKSRGYFKEHNVRDSNHKKEFAYLWPLCALLQAANEVEAHGKAAITFDMVLKHVHAYDDNRAPAPAYASYISAIEKDDRFYDDNQWIGISCLDAYARMRKPSYLEEAKKVYRFMMTGYDTISGGGLYWKEGDLTTKNTCSNGPGVLVALGLYEATKEKAYLDTAIMLYDWTNKWLRRNDGVFYDNVKLPSRQVDKRTYTYNTGTMLESNVILYRITKDRKYLAEAKTLASGAYAQFYKNNQWPGHAWFNAVLLRGFIALHAVDKERKYIDAFIADSDMRWSRRGSEGLFGRKKEKELIEQAGMLEIYARLISFK